MSKRRKLPDLTFLVEFINDNKPMVCNGDHIEWPIGAKEGECSICGRRIVYSPILDLVKVKLCLNCAPK